MFKQEHDDHGLGHFFHLAFFVDDAGFCDHGSEWVRLGSFDGIACSSFFLLVHIVYACYILFPRRLPYTIEREIVYVFLHYIATYQSPDELDSQQIREIYTPVKFYEWTQRTFFSHISYKRRAVFHFSILLVFRSRRGIDLISMADAMLGYGQHRDKGQLLQSRL